MRAEIPQWFIDGVVDSQVKSRVQEGNFSSNEKIQFSCGRHIYTDSVKHIIKLSTGEHNRMCPQCSRELRSQNLKGKVDTSRMLTPEARAKAVQSRKSHGYSLDYLTRTGNSPEARAKASQSLFKTKSNFSDEKKQLIESKRRESINNTLLIKRLNSLEGLRSKFDDETWSKIKRGELTSHDYVQFNCSIHGPYRQRLGDFIKLSHNCPACELTKHTSEPSALEDEIYNLIGVDCVRSSYPLLINGRRQQIDLLYGKIGIEVNGSLWHASLGKIARDGAYKNSLYHQMKFKAAEEQGIHLISIFDVDWFRNKEKILSYLRELILGRVTIGARKTEVLTLTNKEAWRFLDENHLQGHANKGQINYGLLYDGELCAVMSFGNIRFSSKLNHYELHRFACKQGYSVIGGASKLWFRFLKDYNPECVISYSDCDYFTGGLYLNLGFRFESFTNPRYYWYLKGVEYKREETMLHNLKDKYPDLYSESEGKGNREDYIMIKLGASKVYRTGNKKWIYEQ